MVISEEKKLEILYDHYKDSFLHVLEYLKQRERLFVLVLIVIFLQFLQISFSGQYLEAFNNFVEKQFNLDFVFSKEFLNNIFWFLLFSISLRYFQINILINRQYDYLHFLEDKLCEKSGDENFIRREGKGYLDNYPVFSDWAHIVYTWAFPILLIFVGLIKIIIEIIQERKFSGGLLIGGILFLAVCTTTILYMNNVHQKKKNS